MAIISFQHRFIFIKTVKTAGTSVEVDLSRHAGEDAIVTPILPPYPGHEARNYMDAAGEARFFNHMSAEKIRDALGSETFEGMFRFTIEREPVEKCISHFHMLRNSLIHVRNGTYQASWAEYCDAGRFPMDVARYSTVENGRRRLLVDRVLRYDALAQELTRLTQGLGIKGVSLQSRAKAEYSKNRLISPEQVTAAQRAKIYDAYAETLALTGIDWETPPAEVSSAL